MKCQILPVFHKRIQGNLEGESSSLSEVTYGFFQGIHCSGGFTHSS